LAADSATGRTSSTKIGGIIGSNHQNHPQPYPKDHFLADCGSVKDCLRAPDGYQLIISDYSAAHSRLAAELSGDKNLIKVYKENLDAHCVTAANLASVFKFHDTIVPETWTTGTLMERYDAILAAYKEGNSLAKKLRNYSKTTFYLALNFGGKKRLYETFLGEVSLDDCGVILGAFWETYSDLYAFCLGLQKKTKAVLEPINNVFYRTYRLPTGLNRYYRLWSGQYGDQVKINDLVSSHWLLCEGYAMFRAMDLITIGFKKQPDWDARIVTVNHDEIVCLVKEEFAEVAASFVQDTMSRTMGFWVKSFEPTEKKDPKQLLAKAWSEK
jgi:hypothetical protein